jgi:hypothetical protein
MVVNENMPAAAFVWRRSTSTFLLVIALGFAFFALSAARLLVDKEVGLRYGALFMAVSLLLVGSAGYSWFWTLVAHHGVRIGVDHLLRLWNARPIAARDNQWLLARRRRATEQHNIKCCTVSLRLRLCAQ